MTTAFEKKHRDIVKAAIQIFLDKGFLHTSMDNVAQKAMLSKVTVYNHFADKKALFEHVMIEHCRSLSQGKKLIDFDSNETPKNLLHAYAHRMVDILMHKQSIALMRVVIGEASRFPDLANSIWPEGKLPMQEELTHYLLAEHKAQRLLIVNAPLAARQFFGLIKENLVWPTLMGITVDHKQATRESIIEQSIAMFLSYYGVKE